MKDDLPFFIRIQPWNIFFEKWLEDIIDENLTVKFHIAVNSVQYRVVLRYGGRCFISTILLFSWDLLFLKLGLKVNKVIF